MKHVFKIIDSPVGELKLVANEHALIAILWENDDPIRVPLPPVLEANSHPILDTAEDQLNNYFAGTLQCFAVPIEFTGTAFQKQVWQALLTIPFGQTRTYAQIATQIGNPTAIRAVGAANGKNPISIVVPCHRVIGSNGKLTGFAGGLKAKAILLDLESQQRPLALAKS
jgi:methylated-DNA-[protein]-cysteine S-methyltransferase